MTRDEIIALIVAKANEHGLVPYELLGGAIAESGLDPAAWRQGDWPDWSAGLFQQTIKFAEEGDQSASDANVAYVKALYVDPAHACDVAAAKFKFWRYAPDVSPLQAWTAYNLPASYRLWPNVPNAAQRENYRAGLAEAQAILGVNPVPDSSAYNADTRLLLQNDDWSCWDTSARMGVESWGRHPTESWFESQSIADGIESQAVGLEDGSGAAGAAWLTRQYSNPAEGTPTLTAANAASVSFDDVRSVAGSSAVLLGGHRWGAEGHWTFVRRYDPTNDWLELGNPAGEYMGISQTMSRKQFAQVAPCAMVVIRADGTVPAPIPPPPVPPSPSDTIRAQLAAIRAATDAIEAALI